MAFDRIDARPVPYSLGSSQVLDKDLLNKYTDKLDGNEQDQKASTFTSLGEDRFVTEELADVQKTLSSLNYFTPQVAIAEPDQLYRGLIRYCKSPWNPIGDGYEGLVSYDGSVWSRIGLNYDTDITSLQAQITANASLISGKANVSHTHAYTAITGVATARLLGRTTAGTGAPELISIGTGLSMASGVLNASGSKIIRNWLPTDASFPASNYATLDTRNTHPVLDFDPASFESVNFHGVMPDNYVTGATVVVEVFFSMTSATSNDVNIVARLENMQGSDIDADSFGSYASSVTTVPGTSGAVGSTTLNLLGGQLDGITAGDMFRLQLSRNAGAAADTSPGDMEVHMVEMRIA